MSLLKKNKNISKVENSHCSLGFLEQTMMISGADQHDLSVVCQTQANRWPTKKWTFTSCGGGGGGPTASPLPSGLCLRRTLSKHATDNLIDIVSKVIIMQEDLHLYLETFCHEYVFFQVPVYTFRVYSTTLDDGQDSTVVIF